MFESVKNRLNEFLHGGFKIKISNKALVLDVASGGKPYWRANVLLDKFIFDNSERNSNVLIDRDFVVSDVYDLPFKDKSFDFIIARHILEHLDQPEVFLKELQRVGKAGYIETPSSFSEDLFGWPFHVWQIDVEDGELVLRTKNNQTNHQLKKLKPYFDNNNKFLKKFSAERRILFYTRYYWQDKINFRIINNNPPAAREIFSQTDHPADFDLTEIKNSYSLKRKIKILVDKIRRMVMGVNQPFNLFDLMQCLDCRGDLFLDQGVLKCNKCQRKYLIKQGISVLVK
jgi:SAM-dependent methyltransferase